MNGLYTFDRREKIASSKVRDLVEASKKCYYEAISRQAS